MQAKFDAPVNVTKVPDVIEGFPENFGGAWGMVRGMLQRCDSCSLSKSARGRIKSNTSANDKASALWKMNEAEWFLCKIEAASHARVCARTHIENWPEIPML